MKYIDLLRGDKDAKSVVLGIIAAILASIFCLTGMPWLAMGLSIVLSEGFAWFVGYNETSNWKRILLDLLIIAVCSQFAWCAYLI